MNCPIETDDNLELLLAYCAGELDSETETILERHLADCPSCRDFQQSQEAAWQALDAWAAMPVSPDFDRRLYERIEEEAAHSSWRSRLLRPLRPMIDATLVSRGVPLAAAASLLFAAVLILDRSNNVTVPDDFAQRIESIQPDQVERTLDDMEMLRQFRLGQVTETGAVNTM
jgi:anti-sigma factor RsiW